MREILGKYPGKTLHRIGVGIAGFWLGCNMASFFLERPNQVIDRGLKIDSRNSELKITP